MIDYQYQHDAHCMDRRMHLKIKASPRQQMAPRFDDELEFERGWTNFQNQLYYGWRKESA